ncbi:MAG: SpoIID/LytB domain-containing protein [Thermodesulfobacteriota bacterium]
MNSPIKPYPMNTEPKVKVGIIDGQTELTGHLEGNFRVNASGLVSGRFSARREGEMIILADGADHEVIRSTPVRLTAQKDSTFELSNVIIGNRFHWERKEDQVYQGDLVLHLREDGTICAINEISLENYLKSVISSEMSAEAPIEFLKAHAILSRSWLLAGLDRRKGEKTSVGKNIQEKGEVIRWYDREDHDLFDVCSDDHCQRYHGITKVISQHAEEAIRKTNGTVMTYRNEICDARYSKACGGITENFETAWNDKRVPYLRSTSDASTSHHPIGTEEEATAWILSKPDAYCNTKDAHLLERILPEVDRETKDFFRWEVEYSRKELEEILQKQTGFDFGELTEIVPISRGPSARISRLRIVGSKKSMVVGKELEIRRCLSDTHLYSSAFIVRLEADRVVFHGAGWGHGVGLCQIGAAVLATQGFSAEEILKHYFRGVEIRKIY